jgi:hypothetical protein
MSKREEELLAMAEETRDKVSKIRQEVDVHKRYDAHDKRDKYGKVIEWVHETGRKILSE